jgi:hypothetical protein
LETRDGIRYSDSAKKGVNVIKRNILVFAFFLFLSFIFWYLNSLGKDIEADIKYPVSFVSSPKSRTLPEDLPTRLDLILKGPGYSILKIKIAGSKTPIEIDFSRVGAKRYMRGKLTDYYIVTLDLVPNINSQLKSDCKVISVKPDTLIFSFGQVSK